MTIDPEIFSHKSYSINGKHIEYNLQRPGTTSVHYKNLPGSTLE